MDDIVAKVKNYKPNGQVLSEMASIKLLGTVGPSAVGKTTVMEELCRMSPFFTMVIDETTRPKRIYETEGVDFIFREQADVLKELEDGKLVQAAIGPNGHIYSTKPQSYPKEGTGLLALVPPAVLEFKNLPIKDFRYAFIVPPSWEVWQNWLARQAANSDWTKEQFEDRLREARDSLEFALGDPNIHFVLNDDLSRAAQRLEQVGSGGTPDEEPEAKQIAQVLLSNLKANP